MVFWVFVALLILMPTLVLISSFCKKNEKDEIFDSVDADLQIYHMQLKEVDRDCAEGLIDRESAQEARLEIARAILKTEKTAKRKTKAQTTSFAMRFFLSAMVLLVPIIAVAAYSIDGSPGLPAQPFSNLMKKEQALLTPAENLARLEVLALRAPADGTIADELAFAYLSMNRFTEAANRYQDAIRLNGESAARLTGYAMALTENAGGIVGHEAQQLFKKAEALDPDQYFAQIYLATADMQAGKPNDALKRLQAFYQRLPVDSPTRPLLKKQIDGLNAEMNADKRETLLNELHAKLSSAPDHLEGWQLLIKGWLGAGKKDKALAALRDGMEKLSPEKAEALKAYAQTNGLN